MEAKDLILLVSIPLIIVFIFYSAGHNGFSGFATAGIKERSLGTYSIQPILKAGNEPGKAKYSELKSQLVGILESCPINDMEHCIIEKTPEWKCKEDIAPKTLHYLVDRLNECGKLENTVCRFNFQNIEGNGEFIIKLIPEGRRIKADIYAENELKASDFVDIPSIQYADFLGKDSPSKSIDMAYMRMHYSFGFPDIDVFYALDGTSKISLSRKIIAYNGKEGLKFIDFSEEDSFLISPLNNIVDLPVTKGMKFCAKENGMEYGFAIRFPNSPPLPITEVKAFDAPAQENSAIFQWPWQKGVKTFIIYYSEKDFLNVKISEIKNDPEIKKLMVDASSPVEIGNIDLTNCTLTSVGQKCNFGIYNNPLETGKLYKSGSEMIYIIGNILDDKQQYFALTGIDADGNEIDNDKLIEGNSMVLTKGKNYGTLISKDDLPPSSVEEFRAENLNGKLSLSWKKPLKNIDGSDSLDVSKFRIYYKKTASEMPPMLDTSYQQKTITVVEAGCDNIDIECSYEMDMEPGLYNLAITALDEKSNEFKAAETKQILVQ